MGHMCSVMCRGLFECPTCQPLSSDAYLKTRCLLFARIASSHRFGKMWSTALKFPLIQYVNSYLSGLCCGRKRSQRKEKRPKTCRRNCRKPLQCRLVSCHWCGWIISFFIPAEYTVWTIWRVVSHLPLNVNCLHKWSQRLVQNANAVWILHAAWILCLKMLKVFVSRSAVKSESFKAETISETLAFKLPWTLCSGNVQAEMEQQKQKNEELQKKLQETAALQDPWDTCAVSCAGVSLNVPLVSRFLRMRILRHDVSFLQE